MHISMSRMPMPRCDVLAALQAHVCIPCSFGPSGEEGHGALRYTMFAPQSRAAAPEASSR